MNNEDDIFSVKENNSSAQQDAGDASRRRFFQLLVLLAAAGAGAYGAWRFTGGDMKMALMTVGAALITVLSLLFRIGLAKKDAGKKPVSMLRILLNIIVAVSILAAIFYFYARGIDNMVAP